MRPINQSLCLFLLALASAGCASTPEQRIGQDTASFNQYPPATQQRIRAGQVELGFTPAMVRLAKGEPSQVLSQQSATGASEVWVYAEGGGGPNFSIGLGLGSFGGNVGGGLGVNLPITGSNPSAMRVIFSNNQVTAIERATP